MTFSENTNLTPGGQSASPAKVKELENRIDDLQQTVTSVADSVADLSNTVTTSELNATSASISNATVDNATVGSETVTTLSATTASADNLSATDANLINVNADEIDANTVDVTNGYFNSVNAQSYTGSGVNITGDITASNKVQGKTVQATEKVVTPALESTQTELKGATTVRGDVYFPENGDKIYGEYLEIEADKVKADIESDSVNATSVTAGTVTGTAIAAQGLLVTGNSRFMGEVQARDIVPEPGQTLDITTDTLDADSIEADTVKVNSLTTETPTGSSQLVGYDANGNLIPVDAGLDPSNYWEQVPNPDPETVHFIKPKDNKSVQAPAVMAEYIAGMTKIDGVEVVAGDLRAVDTLTVEPGCETTLKDTEVDGDLTVNGDIIQNGSAYETHAEKLYTKKDIIITRDGAVSGLSTGEYTGIQAKKYDGTNDGQLVFDNTGEARVGDIGDTQPILTRDEIANMTDGSLLKWDGTNKKAVCDKSADIIPSDASTSNKLTTAASIAVITANSTTLSGVAISTGSIVRVLFTSDLTGNNASTGLTLTYNGNAYAVKVGKNGALAEFTASEISTGVFKYLQAYTTLELTFDGTQFIIIGNPVVISSSDYTIYADGQNTFGKSCFLKAAGAETQYATIKLRNPSNSGYGNDHICFIQEDYLSRLFRVDCVTGEAYPIDSKITVANLPYINGVYADISNMIVYIRITGYRGSWVKFWQYVRSISISEIAPEGITFNNITFTAN